MHSFKTPRNWKIIVGLIFISAGLILWVWLKQDVLERGMILSLVILSLGIIGLVSLNIRTHTPAEIRMDRHGFLALKLSPNYIPWSEIEAIERLQSSAYDGTMLPVGLTLKPSDKYEIDYSIEFSLKRRRSNIVPDPFSRPHFYLTGYNAPPEEIWVAIQSAFEEFREA